MHIVYKPARLLVVILLLCHVAFAAPTTKWTEAKANET